MRVDKIAKTQFARSVYHREVIIFVFGLSGIPTQGRDNRINSLTEKSNDTKVRWSASASTCTPYKSAAKKLLTAFHLSFTTKQTPTSQLRPLPLLKTRAQKPLLLKTRRPPLKRPPSSDRGLIGTSG